MVAEPKFTLSITVCPYGSKVSGSVYDQASPIFIVKLEVRGLTNRGGYLTITTLGAAETTISI